MKNSGAAFESRKHWAPLAAVIVCVFAPSVSARAEVKHLDAATRLAILSERFQVVKHVADIPTAVMTAAAQARDPKLRAYKIEMADPGQPFQVTDVIVKPGLPGRRLIAAYASADYWILHYEVGGIAHTFHFAAFSFRDGKARLVWHADVRHDVETLNDLRKLLHENDTTKMEDSETDFY